MNVAAIIPAAGKGRRFGARVPKLFARVDGKSVLYYTLKHLCGAYPFREVLIAADPGHFSRIEKMARDLKLRGLRAVRGGRTRAESVRNALLEVSSATDWVLVHDAARPLVSRQIVRRVLEAARKSGGAIAAVPATATVKRVDSRGMIAGTPDRQTLYLAQTPQVFKKKNLAGRYQKLGRKALKLTDEAAFFDGTRLKVGVAAGAVSNLKITTPEDLELFCFYLNRSKKRG